MNHNPLSNPASTTLGSPAPQVRALHAPRLVCSVLAAAALVAGLSACAPLIIGGAVVGGVMAVDRRTTGTQVEDEGIELRAGNRIREALGDRVHVNVTSYNRQVLLTGEAGNAQDRQTVEQIVGSVENVRSVVNDLAIMPNTSLSQRSNDTFITGKVRASLVDAKDISATAFKVVTERNIVYLMGRVSQREANRATDIARGVSGVSKVVRVFEIVSEEELRRIAPQPAPVTTDAKPAGG
ncbi:BON domain-containing protein [Acidovorax sp.]|uniref:BON domain-containing protein n=1 Tax=Acidovorax sp. TaxID=1872122 RepID=UPI00391CF088